MKRTTLTIALLFSLAAPLSVVAEWPPVTAQPLEVEVVPADVESAAQQAVESLPLEAPAAGAGLIQPPSGAEAPAIEAVAPGAAVAEEQPVSETLPAVPADVESAAQQAVELLPTEATAAGVELVQPQSEPEAPATGVAEPGAAMAEEQAVSETPGVEVTEAVSATAASGAEASGAAKSREPCPKYGMGRKHRGKGPDGKGMGMMRGAGCKDKGKHKRHEQVVQRLDMIEARMAKIEAMLESLMKR